MRTLGVMTARHDANYRRSMEVVVRSDRGLEIGQVLCEANDDALSHLDKPAVGSIVRLVSEQDAQGVDQIDADRMSKLDVCQRHIDKLALDMKLIEVEQLFGGERMVVYYLAEERVDFRELVRALATEFSTRIEMRQIGVRDEAKLLADYGDCGKPVCCNTHLSTMPPVSMKMAKLQKATLDPTKISGRCGRLKCCLRYEYDNYVETQKQLPKVGTRVVTRNGTVKVLNQQILAEQLLVETEDHRRMVIDASEVLSEIKPQQYRKEKSSTPDDKTKAKATESGPRKPASQKNAVVGKRPSKNKKSLNDTAQSNSAQSDAVAGVEGSRRQEVVGEDSQSSTVPSKSEKNRKRRSKRNQKRKRGPDSQDS